MLLSFGIENIENRILKLTDRLIEAFKNLGLKLQTPEQKAYRSGIVLSKIDKPREIVKSLRDEGIIISARANGLRVSPHFYNTEAEIDKLLEKIEQCR
jgi:selenocysteine lyase/cysteine desulfurase